MALGELPCLRRRVVLGVKGIGGGVQGGGPAFQQQGLSGGPIRVPSHGGGGGGRTEAPERGVVACLFCVPSHV